MESHLTIVEKCLKGDKAAQRELFEQLSGKMLSLCLRYTGDRMTAEDMLQEGFVTLFSKLDNYKGEGSFEGWARRVFATTCLMYLRKKDALRMSDDLQEAGNVGDDAPSATQQIGYRELMDLVTSMPDGYRTIFNLYVMEGFHHKEIGKMLGISEITSRSQLNRARLWLQNKIKERNV